MGLLSREMHGIITVCDCSVVSCIVMVMIIVVKLFS